VIESWKFVSFEDAIKKVTYTNKIPRKKFLDQGVYPIISQEAAFTNGYWNEEEDVFRVESPLVVFGDHTKVVKHIDFDFVLGADGVKLLMPVDGLDSRFFAYFLRNAPIRDLGYARHYRLLKEIEIPLPPIPEQQRIVAILDQAFADIEKARANAEQNLNNARELFDSYLTRTFSQSGEENQDVMGGWKTEKLSNLGITQTGSTPKTTVKENFGSAIPFVKPADFQPNGLIDYNNDGLSEKGLAESRLVKQDSVLMVCIGATIGKVGYTSVNVTTNQQINSFTPYQGMLTKYCYYAMLNNDFHRQVIYNSSQATLPIINKSKWSSLEIKYPSSIYEQQRIIDSLDKLSDKVQQLKKSYQYKLESLDELKKSLLQKAFSGELTKGEGRTA